MGEKLHLQAGTRREASGVPDHGFAAVGTTLFLLASAAMVSRHQLHIDEAYHYLLARDSATLADLAGNGMGTGHPLLWNILLFFYKGLFPGIVAMQIFHSLIAGAAVYLVLSFSPFAKGMRLLICFGYFFLFEYNVIAKNYAGGILLVIIAIVLFQRGKPLWMPAVFLGAACSMHLFTLLASAALFMYFYRQSSIGRRAGLFIFIVLLLIAVFQIIPDAGDVANYRRHDSASWISHDRLGRTLAAPVRGLVNVPDFRQDSFWNSNLIVNTNRPVAYLLGIMLLAYIAFAFRKRKDLLAVYLFPAFSIMAFVYLAPLASGVRYWGYFYLMLIFCAWLYQLERTLDPDIGYLVIITSAIQVLVMIPVSAAVMSKPFSSAMAAAGAIERAAPGQVVCVRHLSQGPSLSAYLGRSVYYPAAGRYESFSYRIPGVLLSDSEFVARSAVHLRKTGSESCILANEKPLSQFVGPATLLPLATFTGSLIKSEDYFIYLLSVKESE
jgi:hypothetical protein